MLPSIRMFEAIGITELEERIYTTLLDDPGASVADVAGVLGVTAERIRSGV